MQSNINFPLRSYNEKSKRYVELKDPEIRSRKDGWIYANHKSVMHVRESEVDYVVHSLYDRSKVIVCETEDEADYLSSQLAARLHKNRKGFSRFGQGW